MGKILLYYKYIYIEDPHAIMRWQKELCSNLGLKGRILIGTEGINGTVGGTEESTQLYITAMKEHSLFYDVDFKSSPGNADDFPRLRIVVRDEIVTMGINPEKFAPIHGGKHLTPQEAHRLMEEKPKDLLILDARNDFESAIGTFKDALTPDIKNFREFPNYIDKNLEQFQDKQVLMFCTGGIRCERASAYLKEKNVAKEVYQIEGGIHNYTEEFPDGFFRGKNYVFDGRIAVKINDDILGSCYICKVTCDEYTNCINAVCNLQYIACKNCIQKYNNNCSSSCQELTQKEMVITRTIPAKTTKKEHPQPSNM